MRMSDQEHQSFCPCANKDLGFCLCLAAYVLLSFFSARFLQCPFLQKKRVKNFQ